MGERIVGTFETKRFGGEKQGSLYLALIYFSSFFQFVFSFKLNFYCFLFYFSAALASGVHPISFVLPLFSPPRIPESPTPESGSTVANHLEEGARGRVSDSHGSRERWFPRSPRFPFSAFPPRREPSNCARLDPPEAPTIDILPAPPWSLT